MRDRSQGSREDCWNHEAKTLLLLVAYGLQTLKPMNRNRETSAPFIFRLRQPLGQQMSTTFGNLSQQVCKTQKPWQEAPALGPVAYSFSSQDSPCSYHLPLKLSGRRKLDKSYVTAPMAAKEIPSCKGLLGMWTCLTLGKMAGAWTEVAHTF